MTWDVCSLNKHWREDQASGPGRRGRQLGGAHSPTEETLTGRAEAPRPGAPEASFSAMTGGAGSSLPGRSPRGRPAGKSQSDEPSRLLAVLPGALLSLAPVPGLSPAHGVPFAVSWGVHGASVSPSGGHGGMHGVAWTWTQRVHPGHTGPSTPTGLQGRLPSTPRATWGSRAQSEGVVGTAAGPVTAEPAHAAPPGGRRALL